MKLLHVVASYLPATRYGGTIVSVHGLCRALVSRGHDVHVYTTSVDGDADSNVPHGQPALLDGVHVHYFRSRHARRLYWSPDLGRTVRERVREFDVVHTHAIYLWPMWVAARSAHRQGVPYVVSPRGMLEKALIESKSPIKKALLIGMFERRIMEQASAIHVTSGREADEARAFGFNLPRLVEIPNGVDPLIVAPESAVSSAVREAIDRGPYALFLGRINWKKGLDRLVPALPHAPALRLVLAGPDEDGYRQTVEELSRRHGVADRIEFVGHVGGADKTMLLGRAVMLVLPSYSENFGNVVLEAMAAGCPVIVTPEVGVADLVRDSGAGLVSSGSPAELGSRIALLAADAEGRRAFGERGRVTARERFGWDAIAARMEQLYESVQAAARC